MPRAPKPAGPEVPYCDAHAVPACSACGSALVVYTRTLGDGSKECAGCDDYRRIGLHSGVCAYRIDGGIVAPSVAPLAVPADVDLTEREHRNHLERGWKRYALIRDLATQPMTKGVTQRTLADKYGTSQTAVASFKKRNETAIKTMREEIVNQFANLWVADKANRIAEYQQAVDDINEYMERMFKAAERYAEANGVAMEIPPLDTQALRAKYDALKAVAEELGQLPSKVNMQIEGGIKVQYEIQGVDSATLR